MRKAKEEQLLQIEYVDLAAVVRWPRNPKDHDLGELHNSFKRWGYVQPVLMDERTGKLVAGHGRLDLLQQLKASGARPPARIVVKGDAWLIPVIRGVSFKDDAEVEAYLLADNRLVEVGGYHLPDLGAMLADLAAQGSLEGTGYDQEDVDALLRQLEASQHPFAPNTAPDRSQRQVNQDDIERAGEKLADKFTPNEDLVPIICPHCGGEFSLDRDNVKVEVEGNTPA